MKKVSSVVWQFFDRIEEDKRCVGVLCKLCDTVFKYFGNTTNLRAHLVKKHPVQWEFRQNNLDEKIVPEPSSISHLKFEDEDTNHSTASAKRTRFVNVHVDAGDVTELDNDIADEDVSTINLVRQMHEDQQSDVEWLEDDAPLEMFRAKRKRGSRKIKREITTPQHWTPKYKPQISPKNTIIKEVSQPQDEYSVFGEYIANKLRKFKAPRTRGNIQQLITTILWQAEYGMYDDADSVKRVLLSAIHSNDVEQHTVQEQQESEIQTEEYTLHVDRSSEENNQSIEPETALME